MAWTNKAMVLSALALGLAGVGCGDDDGMTGDEDTGPMELDGGPRDAGPRPPDTGPRPRDAGPPPQCDPYTPGSCPEGEKCSVVLEVNPDPEGMNDLFFACVPIPRGGARTEGQFCNRFAEDATPEESSDDQRTDACEQGLFCWYQPGGMLSTCQRLCGDETTPGCPVEQWCNILSAPDEMAPDFPLFGVCDPADNCDPVYQTGCRGGEACYLIGNTTGDFVSECFEFVPLEMMTGEVGETCMFINNCRPGAQCFPDFYPDGGMSMERTCHELCAAPTGMGGMIDAGPPDAGPPPPVDAGPPPVDAGPPPTPDAGPPPRTGGCPMGEMCVTIPLGMGMARVPTPPGVCQ